ncbi:MAG: hypothetical protein ICV60_21045 [Pyrinomonadaceae bacterium]|nr:hypothetical protein [Pyrinomonadaceae bacterium]
MEVNLDTGSFITERVAPDELDAPVFNAPAPSEPVALEDYEQARTLGLWLCALTSFFKIRNHPFSETEQSEIVTRDWSNELRIARRCLLQSAQLANNLGAQQRATKPSAVLTGTGELTLPDSLAATDSGAQASGSNDETVALAETLANLCAICEAMMEARSVRFKAWSHLGKTLVRDLEGDALAQRLMRAAEHYAAAGLQAPLLNIARNREAAATQGADLLVIFTGLARMLGRLRFIEGVLRRDQPLKFLLPIFTLLHEEARVLLEFIETRAMRTDGLDEAIFDTLDGTNYAISMELRKVFAYELVGLSALRQPTVIYAKVENAYGLLRDCFQQSTVALAQLFDPQLEGAQLFDTFQTKLQQSLALRRDLWTLLLLVRRAEKERDQRPVAPLLERLAEFREGSLRYLMYKDWEACERFMEEVGAARGAVELAPVLHRFGAYLETLHGQVNMRAVLANYPFEYPELET